MRILWLTWKDMKNPLAGGAEVVNEELAKRLAKDGHEVLFVVGGFSGAPETEERDGFKIVRVGGRFSVYFHTYRYHKKNLKNWADLVIDEVNTIPFFAKFYVKEKNILFVHQLAREIWFYQMVFPLSYVGYFLEPFYLWLLRDRKTITVSNSTKEDLMRYGHKAENITIISEGIELEPVESTESVSKYELPTLLSLGAMRPMKQTLEIVKAFEYAKQNTPNLQLILAGDTSGAYGATVLQYITTSPHKDSIQILGKVSRDKKIEILQKSHVIAVTSIKEGWGLIVTEANSQGTPAVVYNVDGLRDSVRHNDTGMICTKNTPEELATNITALLGSPQAYSQIQKNALEWSKSITFDQSYEEFKSSLNI